jgi:hypothetical protein
MSLYFNEMAARRAVEHVKRLVPLGAANKVDNPSQDEAAAALTISRTDRVVENAFLKRSYSTSTQVALAAKISGAGNCGDQAAVAMRFLENMNTYPLDMMADRLNDHAFIVIGRLPGSDSEDAATWGPEAVVCDPWSGISGPVNHAAVAAMLAEYHYYESQFYVPRPPDKSGVRESPF